MDLKINGVLVNDEEIEVFPIKVDILNYSRVKIKLIQEKNKIVKLLQKYKKDGRIRSVFIPKDTKGTRTEFQKKLNFMVNTKKDIIRSIEKINTYFM